MAVVGTAQISVRPGQMAAGVANFKQAKAVLESSGGRNVRLLTPLAGPAPAGSTMIVTFECDDLVAWGQINEAYYANATAQKLMAEAYGPDGFAASVILSLFQDVPLD
jgi:hypothetical protein